MIIGISLLAGLVCVICLLLCLRGLIKKYAATFLYPERSLASSSPADFGTAYQDVYFSSSDGLKLAAWYIAAQDPRKSTIIFVHGLKGNRASFLNLALKLTEQGYGALLFDLRNHGASEGNITTMTAQEVLDIAGALTFLKARAEIDPDNIGIVGHSLGAAAALRAASLYRFKFVVAQAAFADLCDSMHQAALSLAGLHSNPTFFRFALYPMVSLMIAYAEKQVGQKAKAISPKYDLTVMTPCPCMFIHGLNDKTISACNSQMLFDIARGERELLLLNNTGHSVEKLIRLSQASVMAFVEKHGHTEAAHHDQAAKAAYLPAFTTASGAYLL